MKGQGSLEFLTVVGIATVISAPFILEAQSLVTSTSETSDITGFQSSLDELVKKIERVDAMGSPAADSVRLDIPAGITEARVISTGTKESSTAIVFTRNRSSQLNNYTRFVEADLQTNDLPTEEGSRKIGIKALNREVKLSYDIFSADFVALDLIEQDSEVTFKDTSETLGNILTNYTWYVNDSIVKSGSSADTLEHLTDEDTDYNITLKIESSEGDTDQISKTYNPDVNRALLFTVKSQSQWNQGIFSGTSADRNDNSGNLGIGYLNGTRSDQPNDVGLNNESLVGYWRLDREISGSNGVLKDYSGLGNDGITKNGVSTGEEGVFSTNGIQVDGSDDYLNVPDESIVEGKNQLTISAWVYTNGRGTGYPGIVVAQNGANQVGIFQHDKRFYYEIGTDDNNQNRIVSGEPADLGKWTHVSLVFNGSSKTMKEYINGTPTGRTETTSTTTTDTDYKNLNIGRWPGGPETFNGSIDEVRIYDRALSPNDIRDLYFNGRNGEFNGSYRSEIFTRSQGTDWSALEVNASVPSETDLTATFETLEQGPLQTAQSYASPSEWNLGSFNTTTADNVVVEKQNVSMLEASKPSEFNQGEFNKTTSDEVVTEYKYPSELEASTQSEFNQGSFNGTSADRNDNSGDLGLGYRNGSVGDNLVGYWRLDRDVSGSGGNVVDYSGEGNNGTTSGGVTTGAAGTFSTKAYDFDGADDYVDLGQIEGLGSGTMEPHTISFWVKIGSISGQPNIVHIGPNSAGKNSAFEEGGVCNPGNWNWYYYSNDVCYPSIPENRWVHVVLAYDGSDYGSPSSRSVYYNATEQTHTKDSSDSNNPLDMNDNPQLYLGADAERGRYFDGSVDDLMIYNRSLSESEVEELYFNGRPFQGNYTAKEIDNGQETNWDSLEVNASIPSDTSVNATFRALDTDGNLVDSQLIDLSEGLSNYSLSVSDSEDAEVFINGSSSNLSKSWEVHGLEVFSREVEDKNDGLRIGYQNGSSGDNLVGYWRFDRNVSGIGGTVKDYSGKGNSGTTTGSIGTGLEGVFGTEAVGFDGTGGQVDIPAIITGNTVTFTAWVKFDQFSDNMKPFSQRDESTDNTAYEMSYVNSDNVFECQFKSDSGNFVDIEISPPSTDEWVHYACKYDGSQGVIYENGQRIKSKNVPNIRTPDDGAIGSLADGTGSFMDGQVDEVLVYNRSLSDSEIEDLYFHGSPFKGNYTAEKIDNDEDTEWNVLEVNASVPSNTSVNATFRALDTDGGLVAEQDVDLGEGLNNYSLSVGSSEDAEVVIDGTSSNVTKTWVIHSLEVYSTEVVDRNNGLRIGYRNGSVGDNLVGYWRLDRNVSGGGTVRDYSGYDSDGTALNGVSTGKKGVFNTSSFAFYHSNRERISVPDISGLFDDEATVSLWLRRKNLNTPSDRGKTGIFRLGTGTRSHYPWKDGRLYLTTFSDSRVVDGFDDTGFDKTEWHHLVISTEPGTDEYVVYRNGDVLVERNGPSTVSLDNDDIRFGHSDNQYAFNGQMDEVRLYNRSLSTQKVRELYFNGRNGDFNGSYTAEKIDKAQEVSWERVEINASVPSDTNLTAEFKALDSDDDVVDREFISIDSGSNSRNYSLSVQDSRSARLSFNGSSSNATKTWKVYDYEIYSGEREVNQSESFRVSDGLNQFNLDVDPSKDARVELNGSTSNVEDSWIVESLSVFN